MNEPVVAVADEAITPEDRVDEIARAIQREPLKFVAIAAVVGFALALAAR